MSDHVIRVRVPAGLDAVLREHWGDADLVVTNELRRIYLTALLAAVIDGVAPTPVADAFARLNGVVRIIPSGARVH